MKWWNELVADNPMMIESKLFMRKFFGAHAVANTLAIGAITLLLGLLIGMMYVYEISYKGPAIAALIVLTILVPILLHGSIAGERERGSWEMLLVAPINSAQIVFGKFMGVVSPIVIITAAFGFAIVVATYPNDDRLFSAPIAVLLVFSFGLCLAAFTLLVSAWSSRSMAALGTVFGSLFFLMLAFPMLVATSDRTAEEMALYLNPYYAVTQLHEERYSYSDEYGYSYSSAVVPEGEIAVNSYLIYGVMHIFIYLALCGLCLWLAAGAVQARGVETRGRKAKENA
jgi:ABC-type transport system involved in multi-copper enzyme maturation permease subunit